MQNFFLEDEEDKKKEEMGPPVDAASLLAQFDRQSKQNADELASAEKKTKAKNYGLGVLEGISGAMGGWAEAMSKGKIQAGSTDMFRNARAENDKDLAGKKASANDKLAQLLQKDKMGREQVERAQSDELFGQKQKDFAHKEDQRDPNSRSAVAARGIVAKQAGLKPSDLEGMSYDQILDFAKTQKQAEAKGWTLTTTVDDQGRTVHAWANPNTREIIPTGAEKGFALSVDQTTGNVISKSNPNQITQTVKTDTGETLRGQRTRLQGERSEAGKIGTETGKTTVEAAKAESYIPIFEEKANDWQKRQLAAYEAGVAGPGSGQVTQLKAKFGFETEDEAVNQLVAEMQMWANDYVKEISGATVPVNEWKERFAPLMPTVGMTPALFKQRIDAFKQRVKMEAERKKAEVAALKGKQATAADAPAKTAPVTNEVRRKTKDGRTAVFNADTKEFIRYED